MKPLFGISRFMAIGMAGLLIVSFVSLAVAKSKPPAPHLPVHLVIKKAVPCDRTKLINALASHDKGTFLVKYDDVPVQGGSLSDPCPTPPPTGNKTTPHVTQQVSFNTTAEMRDFMIQVFP